MLQSGPVGVLMSAFAFVEGLRAHAIVLFNRRSRAGDLLLNCENILNLTVRPAPTLVAVFFRILMDAAGLTA